jgi:hypothetical protein
MLGAGGPALERFRAKWRPVRVKKTRQTKNLEPRFDSIETDSGSSDTGFEIAGVTGVDTDASRSATARASKSAVADLYNDIAELG